MKPDYDNIAHELYPQIAAGPVPISDACDVIVKALQDAYDNGRDDGLEEAAEYVERIGSYGAETTAATIRSL